MVDPTMSLRFKFKKCPLVKDINIIFVYRQDVFCKKGTESIETEKGTVDAFFRKSISTFSIRLTGALFKSQVQLWHIIPQLDFCC